MFEELILLSRNKQKSLIAGLAISTVLVILMILGLIYILPDEKG